MGNVIRIRRGFDIHLTGAATQMISDVPVSPVVAVKPPDFAGVKPRLEVAPGDQIQAGQCLFTDKRRPELRFTSPVSGEIAEVILGPKRRKLEIRILPDEKNTNYKSFPVTNPASQSREQLIHLLTESGCWNFIRQRPYSIIAHPGDTPKAIFISMFDTAPLAPDLSYVVQQEPSNFTTGLEVLQQLSGGKVHLCFNGQQTGGQKGNTGSVAEAHIHSFSGPHPAGNVGIQIHHIDPIRKGDIVWYVHPQDVIVIGRLFSEGRFRHDRIIALTGSGVKHPQYLRVSAGQRMKELLAGHLAPGDSRIILGNVLTGDTSSSDDFLSFYTQQVTVIPEGHEPEFLGWLLPGFDKLSLSRTFFSWLRPKHVYDLNTNLHGEERAFVMTGEYDRVLPMNILPVFLLKAILARDIERMEELGIYEVAEEDFALCEFVCTSKINVQEIVRDGLQLMMEEG